MGCGVFVLVSQSFRRRTNSAIAKTTSGGPLSWIGAVSDVTGGLGVSSGCRGTAATAGVLWRALGGFVRYCQTFYLQQLCHFYEPR